jgi:hypothetical protein
MAREVLGFPVSGELHVSTSYIRVGRPFGSMTGGNASGDVCASVASDSTAENF